MSVNLGAEDGGLVPSMGAGEVPYNDASPPQAKRNNLFDGVGVEESDSDE